MNGTKKHPIPANKQRMVILLHENGRPHFTKWAIEWEILLHAYSLDYAQSDYYLFRLMKSVRVDQQFRNHEEIKKMAQRMYRMKKTNNFFSRCNP